MSLWGVSVTHTLLLTSFPGLFTKILNGPGNEATLLLALLSVHELKNQDWDNLASRTHPELPKWHCSGLVLFETFSGSFLKAVTGTERLSLELVYR